MKFGNFGIVEHVAFQVSDINWHINFFAKVFGMKVNKVIGSKSEPEIAWLSGGIQLISVKGPLEKMNDHIGIVVTDLEATLDSVENLRDVHPVQGKERNWISIPDGVVLELIQGRSDAVNRLLENPLR